MEYKVGGWKRRREEIVGKRYWKGRGKETEVG